ncbi:MAG: hypothetical protein OJF51_000605 [Nitrospira sp.]|nr:MAG: hypothetical protein OJF51_000605 [Nitrospira sp.]
MSNGLSSAKSTSATSTRPAGVSFFLIISSPMMRATRIAPQEGEGRRLIMTDSTMRIDMGRMIEASLTQPTSKATQFTS